MHLEFLLEGQSDEIALRIILPKILPENITYDFHVFQSKDDMIKKLPKRLRGYRRWLPPNWRIVILLDNDRGDCVALKEKLATIALQEGFESSSATGMYGQFNIIIRLAIQELEAWFFGDFAAINAAYPRVSTRLKKNRHYRDPDGIANPSKVLEKIFQKAGYYSGGLPKKEAARRISENMAPMQNCSKSFQIFRDTLLRICRTEPVTIP